MKIHNATKYLHLYTCFSLICQRIFTTENVVTNHYQDVHRKEHINGGDGFLDRFSVDITSNKYLNIQFFRINLVTYLKNARTPRIHYFSKLLIFVKTKKKFSIRDLYLFFDNFKFILNWIVCWRCPYILVLEFT